ncbi:MAG: DeoR/GlpR family DNA-binding transcription regulator [Alphaproteobacteria bacterium]|nr:DeoR/GlpR family DNA-binding transcription regulator [Alphaproteobacteria bacterium]
MGKGDAMKRRLTEIVKQLRITGYSTISELAQSLKVSEETIRRDLKVLQKEGLIEKHHGSATLRDYALEPNFRNRVEENRDVKRQVATLAAELVNDGDVVFLDIGTTTSFVAEALKSHRDLTIVTNSVVIANLAFMEPGFKTFLTGGEIRSHDGGVFGPDTYKQISSFCINKAILSTAGIHQGHGFLTHHLCEAELYSKVARDAELTIVCADAAKYNRRAPIKLCDYEDIDVLVSDTIPPKSLKKLFKKKDITLRLLEAEGQDKASGPSDLKVNTLPPENISKDNKDNNAPESNPKEKKGLQVA